MKILQESSAIGRSTFRDQSDVCVKLKMANQPSAKFFYKLTSFYQDTKV